MIRVAIIGGIGSGKSHLAKLFGYPIFNADLEVSRIYKKDRKFFIKLKKKLKDYFFSYPLKKEQLIKCILDIKNNLKYVTEIVHPLVRKKLNFFLKKNNKKKNVILDIPLYFENKLNKKKDVIIFVDAKKKDIIKRLKRRKNYNKALINRFKKLQLPLEKKKKKTTLVFKNNFKNNSAKKYVKNILKYILK